MSDHGENKNSPLHTGWRHISRGWSKKKQLEMPGYAETKTIFIGILVYNDTNDSSLLTIRTQGYPFCNVAIFQFITMSHHSTH